MSSVKLTRTDLKVIEKNNDQLSQIDKNLIDARKQSIFTTLTAATESRMKHLQKMQTWIDQVGGKIFNPIFIAELSPEKTIALFKYLNNLNLKALAESGKLETILTNYMNSGALEMSAEISSKQNIQKADISQLKSDIMSKISSLIKTNVSDAHIVNDEEEKDLHEDAKQINKELGVDDLQEDKDVKDEMESLDLELDNLDI